MLQKCIWYVDNIMVHVFSWTGSSADSIPTLKAIHLWAHLKNVPFDLIHNEGLGFIAGPLGEPKEMDDWTK